MDLGCSHGHTFFGGRCFALISERKTWKDAREYCTNLFNGYDIVTIHGQSKNNFIRKLVEKAYETDDKNKNFWIGLKTSSMNDKTTTLKIETNDYIWRDGTSLSYGVDLRNPPWMDNEPNQVIF